MPKYPYRELGVGFDRNFRNDLNANFDDVEADFKDLDTRIDNIVADAGSSNTEIVDARYDSVNGVTYKVLKDRLDDTANKIGNLSEEIEDVKNGNLYDNSIPSSKLKISADADRIKLEHLSDEVLQAMAGTTPVNATPGPNSVTTEKIAPKAITRDKFDDDLQKHTTEDWYEESVVYGITDKKGRSAFSIDQSGTVKIFNASFENNVSFKNNSIDDLAIKGHVYTDESISNILWGVVDSKERLSELLIDREGKVPDWVISKWKERMDALESGSPGTPSITCWGDSLTAGAGGGGTSYPGVLASLSGLTVYNRGVGGESSATIACRQGGRVILVNNFTIPADTTPVKIADYNNPLKDNFGRVVNPLRQGTGGVNPCYIAGVEGTLSITQTSSNDYEYFFQRTNPGSEVVVDRPTPIITDNHINRRDDIMVIFIGQNGGYSDDNELINQIRSMVDFSRNKQYVVCGLTTGNATSRAALENAMQQEFGRRFINLREYLSTYGVYDAGITPTQADLDAMAVGAVPPSLLSDTVHFNSYGYTVIGNQIYKRLKELEII
jgi:lysophospholipase L1-like esterase